MYRLVQIVFFFLLQTFPSLLFVIANCFSTACFDEVDRARLQLALQQFAKENNSSPGDI